MKIKKKVNKILKGFFLIAITALPFLFIQKTSSQYYYYDSSTSTYPYQQGCNETLNIRINTQGTGIRAGRFHLILDPSKFYYSTSSDPQVLRNDLFSASSQTFGSRSSELSPSRGDLNKTILQIDRKNNTTNYNGSNGLYGVIRFIPLYNSQIYSGSFGMEYIPGPSTTETTLSLPGGIEAINPTLQSTYMTGVYNILQQPCVDDTNPPNISVSTPINGSDKQSRFSGISLNLNEAIGVNGISNVPYIRTGGIRTGNPGLIISNQYGIDLNSFSLVINGNGQTKTFTGGSPGITIIGSDKTRQGHPKNYSINIDPSVIYDYGIEKIINITTNISDRRGNNATQNSTIFNIPQGPKLLGIPKPNSGDIFVNLSSPIQLSIQDNRAGVNSGSIKITLSGINGTEYGPYIFSGNDLSLSGLESNANQPNYFINITNHPEFPASGQIKVVVYAQDMELNIDEIGDYTFWTRPSCSELQCCDVTIISKDRQTRYDKYDLYIIGPSSPIFYTGNDGSGYIDCNSQDIGLKIYHGDGHNPSGSNILSPYYDGIDIILSGRNGIKATLSGNTIYLSIVSLFGYNLTGAILFTSGELAEPTLIGDLNLDITINNSFSSGIVIQSTGNKESPNVIEAYIPPETQIIQTGLTCNPTVIQKPTFTGQSFATTALLDYNIYSTIKIGLQCLGSQIKFYNSSGESKEIEIRIKDPNLIQSGILKIRYSNDLINRNSLGTANIADQIASFHTTHFTYFALGYDKPRREEDSGLPGGGGGGGIRLIKDNCPDGDFSDSYYDNDCGSPDSHFITNYCGVGETKYSQEQVDAFQYAYGLGITTMCPIETARLDGYILRKELAKMISEFAIKIVGIYPNFSKNECNLYDDLRKESDEMQFYIKLSCKLGLMGLHTDGITPKENFDPNQYVTRAQFGTIISRLIFGGKYNGNIENWYIDHLNALKLHEIMNYIETPQMKELRGYVMIMMQRADENGIIRQMRSATDFINGAHNLWNINLYENIAK